MYRNRADFINLHEHQKDVILNHGDDKHEFLLQMGGVSSHLFVPRTNIGFETVSFFLDSVNREPFSNIANGQIIHDLSKYNDNNEVTQIIRIRTSDFTMPVIPFSANTPDPLYFRKVYVQISELTRNQSVRSIDGNRFHFEYNLVPVNNQVFRAEPVFRDFILNRPVQSLGRIQLLVLRPLTFAPINLQNDIIKVTTVPGSNPAMFNCVNDVTESITDLTGPLFGNDRVLIYARNFVSGVVNINIEMQNPNGLFITNILNQTQFEVGNVDFTNLTEVIEFTIIIAKNRIPVTLDFMCSRTTNTNFLLGVQK